MYTFWKIISRNARTLTYSLSRAYRVVECCRSDGMQITSENRNHPVSSITGCVTRVYIYVRVIHWQIKSRARSIR